MVFFVLYNVFVLNLFPILLNFSDSPLMYGIDTMHTGLLSLEVFLLSCGFLLITVYHFSWVCIRYLSLLTLVQPNYSAYYKNILILYMKLITNFFTCGGWLDSKCRYPVCVGFLYTVIFSDVLSFTNNTTKNGIATSSSFSMVNFLMDVLISFR